LSAGSAVDGRSLQGSLMRTCAIHTEQRQNSEKKYPIHSGRRLFEGVEWRRGSQVSIQVEPDFAIALTRNCVVVPSLRHDWFIAQHVIIAINLEESIDVNPSLLPSSGVEKFAEPGKIKIISTRYDCLF
jgi:hypothetical protein